MARLSSRGARAGVGTLVVLDLIALVALSVHRTTTTTQTVRPAANQPVVTQTGTVTPTSSLPGDGGELVGAPVGGQPIGGQPTVAPPFGGSNGVPSSAAPTSPTSPATGQPHPAIAACPIPLREPATNGGLQSLIDFAPAFGPFSAEAFAAASAYQPLLQLIGPILAQYPKLAPKLAPLLDEFLTPWERILDSGFGLLAPFYAPHRQAVLQAESKLAAFFAPYAQQLASSPLGGCVIDLEAALVGDVTVASSATPQSTPQSTR